MGHSTTHKLGLVCLASSIVPHSLALIAAVDTAQAVGLFPRQASSCGGDSSLNPCGEDLPSEFCCPESSTCIPLNGGSSVICCPAGRNCDFIQAITCDMTQQNATEHPSNLVHSIDLEAKLPECGDACCPLGYSCQSGTCRMEKETKDSPSSSTTSIVVPTTTSTSSPVGLESGSNPTTTDTISTESKGPEYPTRAVLAGFFPGFIGGALFAVATMFLLRRYRLSNLAGSPSTITSLGPPALRNRLISGPISHPHFGNRTDFIRRPTTTNSNSSKGSSPCSVPTTSHSTTSQMTPAAASAFSFPFSKSPPRPVRPPSSAPSASVYSATPAPPPLTIRTSRFSNRLPRPPLPIRALFGHSPKLGTEHRRPHKSASSETIDVLMPPTTGPSTLMLPPKIGADRRETGNTTFSALMEAGVGGGMASGGYGRGYERGMTERNY